eukprot:3263928-Prymnesium_polylepis.1
MRPAANIHGRRPGFRTLARGDAAQYVDGDGAVGLHERVPAPVLARRLHAASERAKAGPAPVDVRG